MAQVQLGVKRIVMYLHSLDTIHTNVIDGWMDSKAAVHCNGVLLQNNNDIIPLLPFYVNSFPTKWNKDSNVFSAVDQLINVIK